MYSTLPPTSTTPEATSCGTTKSRIGTAQSAEIVDTTGRSRMGSTYSDQGLH